jgi:hypothetical protein
MSTKFAGGGDGGHRRRATMRVWTQEATGQRVDLRKSMFYSYFSFERVDSRVQFWWIGVRVAFIAGFWSTQDSAALSAPGRLR